MTAFSYQAPGTLADAVRLLAEQAAQGLRTQILAGGTDLLVQLRSVDRAPRMLVDIKRLAETNRLDVGDDETFVGAAVSSALMNEHDAFTARFPGLAEAGDLIGSTQIQGRATICGNLCNSSPAGDSIPAMIACGARCLIAGPNGEREVAVEDFITGVGQNVLAADEFLVGLKIANPAPRSADAYLRFIPRTEMDIAVAGCGVAVTLDDAGTCTAARVAIGAVAPTPLLVSEAADALVGTRIDEAALANAGEACSAAAQPISDKRGTADYRRRVIGVLCRRAAAIARDRAGT